MRMKGAWNLRRAILPVVVLIVAVALGGAAFVLVRNFVVCWSLTSLPGMPLPECGLSVNPLGGPNLETGTGTPAPATATATPQANVQELQLPPAWDGASRINVLFIGLDYRDWEAGSGAPRSDTMIVFTLDPITRTAGMLSIPRDMWVNIPGYGYGRINMAYSIGEGSRLPGGGPALAMKTVEQFLGVPIHYYGQIDFRAFEEAIDALGGLYICIPEKIRVDPIGPKPKEVIKAGCQTLPGYLVLAYARDRKSTQGGDVDRAKRQQLVVMALREQLLSPQNLSKTLAAAPKVYREASVGLRTNLTFDDMLRLGMLLKDIPPQNIKQVVIDYSMVTMHMVELGGEPASVFKPIPDKIRLLRDEVFGGGALSPISQGTPQALVQAEGPRVRVLNASYTADLAQRTANYLLSQGVPVSELGNAGQAYDRTIIVLHTPKLYTLRTLVTLMGVGPAQIRVQPDAAAGADVEIFLGNDWVARLPAGF
jgi:LCP family protein required for cell wall assembly